MGTCCPCCEKEDKKRKKQYFPIKDKVRVKNKQKNTKKDEDRDEDRNEDKDEEKDTEKDEDRDKGKDIEKDSIDISYDNNSVKFNITEKPVKKNKTFKGSPKKEPKKLDFPPGEHYYQLIKDSNKSELIKKDDNLSEKVELFFSLKDAKNPNDEHSFLISIINNARIGNITHLGKLENRKGKEIEFGNSFQIDFFFEREQIVIIEPIINNNKIENKKEQFVLCKLMTRMDNKLSIDIEGIGILEINHKKKEKANKELNDETSIFQFSIILNSDIFSTEESLEGIYFVIRNIKDGKTKRPVYKSHEYNFKLNEMKKSKVLL